MAQKWIDVLWYTYIFTWYLAGWRNLQRSWQPWQYCWWDIWPRYSVPVWGSCTGYFQFLFHVHIYLRFLGAWHLKRIVSDVNKDCWSLPIVNCFLYRQYLHNRFTLLTSPRCYSVFAERAWIIKSEFLEFKKMYDWSPFRCKKGEVFCPNTLGKFWKLLITFFYKHSFQLNDRFTYSDLWLLIVIINSPIPGCRNWCPLRGDFCSWELHQAHLNQRD